MSIKTQVVVDATYNPSKLKTFFGCSIQGTRHQIKRVKEINDNDKNIQRETAT
jgi:hypothetical protein